MPNPRSSVLAVALLAALPAMAQEKSGRPDENILKSIKLPEGYEATVFAKAPELGYPTACSAAADGTLFVAVDENGSLDRGPKRGRVVRVRDTKGTGKADELKVFAEMDSPRGVVWIGPKGNGPGTLVVVHPPTVTAYTDTDGDGVADKQEDIVTGLGFDLKFRGADHTTNGCRLGIDGFIYIAVGDYGYIEAKGKDGTTIKNRGGGIVRVRPDGTGLEIVSRGQRNIYDVAVSPTLDIFTRDNTNDGGGWNDRLSFVPPGAHMGYPYFFKNFTEDMLQPLADYGDGSPCGALWLDEPGTQNGLYTVEWGRNGIDYHPLKAKGAGWEAQQQQWMKITRPTDMDVDAAGHIYVTSWDGATFTYNGPNAGYVLRLTKKDAPKVTVPDFGKLTPAELVKALDSASSVVRQTAQSELLRRGIKADVLSQVLASASATNQPVNERIAALETASLSGQDAALGAIAGLMKEPAMREHALRALGEDTRRAAKIPSRTLVPGLTDADPRVRAAAITAIRRLKKTDAAQNILPLVADADPIVSHLAVRTLSELKASQVCLAALDAADEKVKPGALRALYGFYDQAVVDGLISRLPNAKGENRRGILNALCRLFNQDAPYTTPQVWWGTHPDTSGPVYQPLRWEASDKIEGELKKALAASNDDDARWLVQRMYATKLNFPGLIELMLAKAGNDTAAKLTAIQAMVGPDQSLPSEALAALQGIASDEKQVPELRSKALRSLQRASAKESGLTVAINTFAQFTGHDLPHPSLTTAYEDFTRDPSNAHRVGVYEKLAVETDPAKRTLAQTVLVNMATSSLVKGKDKENAEKAVQKCWEKPEAAASLLGVIARTKARSFADQVQAHLKDPNNAVAEAALFAYQALGLKETSAPTKLIGQMTYDEVFTVVQKGGDAAQGKDMFLRVGCIACHTTSADEPPKGPNLSAVAKMYDRAALTESILKPSAKIAQGFETAWFKTKKGMQIEGFVTREGGDSVDVRNIAGQTLTLEQADIVERGVRPQSMMPEGLLNGFTPADLANLLSYLESLKTK
jgi:putative heme-binding domain-containing protein